MNFQIFCKAKKILRPSDGIIHRSERRALNKCMYNCTKIGAGHQKLFLFYQGFLAPMIIVDVNSTKITFFLFFGLVKILFLFGYTSLYIVVIFNAI